MRAWRGPTSRRPISPRPSEPKQESVEERQQKRKEAFEAAVSGQDFDKVLAALEEMIGDKEVSDEDKLAANFAQFRILTKEKHDGAKACPLAKKLSEAKKDDPEVLNELAWTILDTADLKNRDLDLALTIAKQAAEVSKYDGATSSTPSPAPTTRRATSTRPSSSRPRPSKRSKRPKRSEHHRRDEDPDQGDPRQVQGREGQAEELCAARAVEALFRFRCGKSWEPVPCPRLPWAWHSASEYLDHFPPCGAGVSPAFSGQAGRLHHKTAATPGWAMKYGRERASKRIAEM